MIYTHTVGLSAYREEAEEICNAIKELSPKQVKCQVDEGDGSNYIITLISKEIMSREHILICNGIYITTRYFVKKNKLEAKKKGEPVATKPGNSMFIKMEGMFEEIRDKGWA